MKKIITVLVIAVMALSALSLTACSGSGSGGKASDAGNPGDVYRVVVTDESGAGVSGVVLQFCSENMCVIGETDADGIAVFDDQEEGDYFIHVYSVPEGYAEDDTEYDVPETYGDVNITLKAR